MLPVLVFSAKPLVQFCAAVCVALTAVSVGMMAAGYIGNRTTSGFELMRCGDQPCFRGITPGQTNWADAVAVFKGQQLIQSDTQFAKIALFPSSAGDTVGGLLLDRPLGEATTVGAVLAVYGTPTCLEINRVANTLILHYPGLHVLARFRENRFNPESQVVAVVLGQVSDAVVAQKPVCSDLGQFTERAQTSQHVWQGFASLQHYLNPG